MRQEFENYFVEALHNAKMNELVDSFRKKGFEIEQEHEIEDNVFDLLVKNPKDGHVTAFEIKVLPLTRDAQDNIERLLQIAKDKDYEFRLVTIARPTKYSVSIDWLDEALLQFILEHRIEELDNLATHVSYDDLSSEIRSMDIEGDNASASIDGTIEIVLKYGSGSDRKKEDGLERTYSVSFEGRVTLDLVEKRVESADIRVDLSDW
jgi:hypothetical protein